MTNRSGIGLMVALVACFSMTAKSVAQPSFRDYWDVYEHLQREEYAKVESLYEIAAQQPAIRSSVNHAESFFSSLRMGSGGAGGSTPKTSEAWEIAKKWVQASPESVPAATFLARLALRDTPALPDWAEQESRIAAATKALDQVKEQGGKDPIWNSSYIALRAMGGATPKEVLKMVASRLPHMSEPGERFFQELVTSLNLRSTDAMREVRDLADLAVRHTAQTRGKGMYAVIYLATLADVPELRVTPFKPGVTDWLTMDAALTDLLAYRDSELDKVSHAALACIARDRKRTIELFVSLPTTPEPIASRWARWGGEVFYERCKAWAYGESMPS